MDADQDGFTIRGDWAAPGAMHIIGHYSLADFGKKAFALPPLSAHPSMDAKVTTSDLAKRLESFALFGPPYARVWTPTFEERYCGSPNLITHNWDELACARPT